ncbi:hypothetical protein GALL_201400 [mine drainage metagenome]|uniref:Uncharacterized protein n=1 Tax=mine drainage metagenome TaxID=410659 RepID=A0A1J5S0X5_9ZZZZ
MGMSNAERQAKYRRSRARAGPDQQGERRLNTWLSTEAALALDHLARHYNVAKREMIERLALEAQRKVLATLPVNSPEWKRYFNVTV